MIRASHLFLLFLPLAIVACAGGDRQPPPETVDEVNLERYMGTWYEIARLPNSFQDHCVSDTTAEYSLRDDGRVNVINRCRTAEGEIDAASGIARVADDATGNSKLEVSFFDIAGWRPVWGDYWIIGLERGYDWAIIGHPERETGWILSRSPRLTDTTRERINRLLREKGYDPARFIETPHTR